MVTRTIFGIYDSNIYGLHGIAIVQTLTFFPVCYLMLKGLLRNIDPSLEEASRDMGASRWKVFTTITLPLLLPVTVHLLVWMKAMTQTAAMYHFLLERMHQFRQHVLNRWKKMKAAVGALDRSLLDYLVKKSAKMY